MMSSNHATQQALVDCPRRIDVGDLYATSTDVLLQFQVRNVSEHVVQLAPLASPAAALTDVRYQLQNENVRHRHDESAPFVVQSTQCNQLFNCVNVLPFARPALTLAPQAAVSLICVFQLAATTHGDGGAFRAIQDALLLAVSIVDGDVGDELISIALVGRCCETRLSVDVNEFITFDDCVVGSVYVRDITLRNLAEIELVYSLLLSGPNADCVAFEDYDTGTIKSLGSLAGHASETLRVVFRPRTAGSFTVQVVVQNDNDPSQRVAFDLMADVSTTRQHALICEPPLLDFGACYTMCERRAQLKLINTSDKLLEIELDAGAQHTDEFSYTVATAAGIARRESDDAASASSSSAVAEQQQSTTIDAAAPVQIVDGELSIVPGATVIVDVVFCAKPDAATHAALIEAAHAEVELDAAAIDDDADKRAALEARVSASAFLPAAALATRTQMMRLALRCASSDGAVRLFRRVTCRAQVTTSFFVCSPAHINLGDCAVGQLYGGRFVLQNSSSVATRVHIDVQSKCVYFKTRFVDLAPNERQTVQFDFVPRKVNAHYRKQVTLSNANNPANEWHVVVVSNNVDVAGVATHSYYYELSTPLSRNFLSFDNLVVNNDALRTFSIVNVCRSTITLRVSPSNDKEVAVYRLEPRGRNPIAAAVWTADANVARTGSAQAAPEDSLRRTTIARPASSFLGIDFGGGSSEASESAGLTPSHSTLSLTSLDELVSPRAQSGSIARRTSVFAPIESVASVGVTAGTNGTVGAAVAATPRSAISAALRSANVERHYLDLARPSTSTQSSVTKNEFSQSELPQQQQMLVRVRRSRGRTNPNDLATDAGDLATTDSSSNKKSSPGNTRVTSASPIVVADDAGSPLQRRSSTRVPPPLLDDDNSNDLDLANVQSALMRLLADCEQDNAPLPPLSSAAMEHNIAQSAIHRAERLRSAIADGLLAPVTDLRLEPGHEELIAVVWTPRRAAADGDDRDGTLRKREASLEFHLRSFDRSVLPLGAKLPSEPRSLQLTGKVCHLMMDLAQRHLNFGPTPLHNAARVKTLVIGNCSAVPLLYAIADPGTIASRAIHIAREQRLGIVLPYRIKEIRFTFRPTFTGNYSEHLRVLNVRDRSNDGVVHIKAQVLKPRQFTVSTLQLPFGHCALGGAAPHTLRFVIENMGRARQYVVQLVTTQPDAVAEDGDEVSVAVPDCVALALDLVAEPAQSASAARDAQARELELDDAKRKLRIAETKGDNEKAEKLTKRIGELEQAASASASAAASAAASTTPVRGTNSILVQMPANTTLGVLVALNSTVVGRLDAVRRRLPLPCTAAIRVADAKNVDASKVIQLSMFFERVAPQPRVTRNARAPMSITTSRRNSVTENANVVDVRAASFAALAALQKQQQLAQQLAHQQLQQAFSPSAVTPQQHSTVMSPVERAQSPAVMQLQASELPLLRFPMFVDEPDSCGIDLGTCYVDAQSEQVRDSVVPFDLVGCDPERRTLSVDLSSNLAKQLYVFADEALRTPARDVRIAPDATVRVYIVARPNTLPREVLRGTVVRELVGGLHVEVREAGASLAQSVPPALRTYTLRFRAFVGLTLLRVAPTALRHVAQAGATVSGKFRVIHDTPSIRTEFTISGGDRVRVSRTSGVLTGAGTAGAACEIAYEVGPLAAGWVSERLCVFDAMSSRRCFITVSVHVDDGSLQTSLVEQLDRVPVLSMPTLVVSPLENEFVLDARFAKLFHSFDLTNRAAHAVRITPLSNLNLIVVWQTKRELDEEEMAIQVRDAAIAEKVIHVCGAQHTLRAGETVTVHVSPPLPSQLRAQKMARLRRAQAALFRGQLQFQQTALADDNSTPLADARTFASHAVLVRGAFHASFIELVPRVASVGLIGHENQYQPATVQLRLRNATAVDFRGMFEAPYCVTFVATHVTALHVADDEAAAAALEFGNASSGGGGGGGVAQLDEDVDVHGRDVWVRARREVLVQAIVHSDRLMLQPGPFQFDVILHNSRNATNTLRCEIGGSLTAPPLRLTGLDERIGHARPSLTLHSVGVPLSPATAPEYVWFTVHNVAPHAMRLTLVATLNTPLNMTLGLDIVSESSNAHVSSVTLLSDTAVVIGVRVRAGRIPHRSQIAPDTIIGTLALQPTMAKKGAPTQKSGGDEGAPDAAASGDDALLSDGAISLRPTVIDIRAQARLLPTFELSTSQLTLRPRGAPMLLLVRALPRTAVPVQYRVSLRGALAPYVRVEPLIGHVPRSGVATLRCYLLASADVATLRALTLAPSGETTIVVQDVNYSWCVCETTVLVDTETTGDGVASPLDSITRRTSSSSGAALLGNSSDSAVVSIAQASLTASAQLAASSSSSVALGSSSTTNVAPQSPRHSTIEVHGCSVSAGRYTINMGQQIVGTCRTWSLRLSTSCEEPVPFRITKPSYHTWLVVEPLEGVVSAQASVSVQLQCTADAPAVLGSFILVENKRNVASHRLIRANMVVVAADTQRMFSIRVGGGGTTAGGEPNVDLIDFGDIFYNTSVQRVHFFEIRNDSEQALSFKLTSNLVSGAAAHRDTELRFSLSAAALDYVRYVSVSAKSSLRVYVVLFAASDDAQQREPIDVVAEAIVTCRVVKDHRHVLRVRARCRQPSLRLSNSTLLFNMSHEIRSALPLVEVAYRHARVLNVLAPIVAGGAAAAHQGVPSAQSLIQAHVALLDGDDTPAGVDAATTTSASASAVATTDDSSSTTSECPIRYVVRNRTLFFECSGASRDAQGNVHGALPGVVRIWPRAEAIEEHREALMSQREVMEELVVYNAAEPGEKHVLSLTLRLAPPTALRGRFPITRDNYAFMALEMCVTRFLEAMAHFWQQYLPEAGGGSDDAVLVSGALERMAHASAPLYVELCWLTDELIKFGSSKHVAYADVLSLAHVLFRYLFDREPLSRYARVAASRQPALVRKWLGQLQYYLSYETYLDADSASFATLRPLLDRFEQQLPPPATPQV